MKRYTINETVEPGIYFCLRRLAFRSMETEGKLCGESGDVYVRVPAVAMIFVGPLLGLLFVLFLPVVGIWMTARVGIEKLRERVSRGTGGTSRPAPGEVPIHLRERTRIHAPLERAYALARDPEHWSDWWVGPDECADPSYRHGALDTVGMRFPLCNGVVAESLEARHAHWRSEARGPAESFTAGTGGVGLILSGVQDWTWEAVGDETELTVEVDCAVPLESPLREAPPETLGRLEAASLGRSLDNLRHYCEHVH